MNDHTLALDAAEPPTAFWRDPITYDRFIEVNFITPLQEAAQQHGHAPRALQLAVLQQLHWYFTVDIRERAPTVALTTSQAPQFHALVGQVMRHIEADMLQAAELQHVSSEVRHALLSYQLPVLHTNVALDAYDHAQGLVRLSYYVHGTPPPETFLIDGVAVQPTYAKYRGCRYFHKLLLRQRLVWLPVAAANSLQVLLAGAAAPVTIGPQPFTLSQLTHRAGFDLDTTALLPVVRAAYPPGKGGQQPLPKGWAGWKVKLLLALARMPLLRQRFAKAWVFMDRAENADDNAEHLYRWVRQRHPEINAWFLIDRDAADWNRLAAEGFRLMSAGLMRQLLILNSEHIISSHADHVFGGLDRRLYGDAMRWRYTFLQHGVTKDDMSHWLGPREFDGFVTSSPAEHQSIVGDDTAYPYTAREVFCTGMPRHDRLLQISRLVPASEVDALLIMPTWRASLVDDRLAAASPADRLAAFSASDYARHWRGVLHSDKLRNLAAQHGQRVVFMPHPNAVPYLDAFDLPGHVELAQNSTTSMQHMFARCAGFVTDYTSVAFEMAFLRRAVFYYQFDRDHFYSGGHNWRPGYFDFDRDGFGPVSDQEEGLLGHLEQYFSDQGQVQPQYLVRMQRAMPYRDDLACQRVYKKIIERC